MKDDRLLEMRVFRAVVDAGGFTAAAHVLGVSQPFVSQVVAGLERRLGVTLLHRSTRGSRVTAEGQRYLESCSRILLEVDEAEAALVTGRSAPVGDLRVSASLGFGMDQVVPLVPRFLETHPDIKLHLTLTDALSNLIEDNVDVAIRMGRLTDSTLLSRRICGLQRVVVAAPAYLDAHGTPQTPDALLDHNCLEWQGPLDHLNRWPFIDPESGRTRALPIQGNFRSSNGLSLFDLCLAGVGIMRLAEHMALPAIRRGALVPLLEPYQARDEAAIHAVYLPERDLLPRTRLFVDFLVTAFRTPPWQV